MLLFINLISRDVRRKVRGGRKENKHREAHEAQTWQLPAVLLYIVHYILYSLHCILYTVYCIL